MKAGKVRRSIQRFEDYSRDLISSDMNSFEDRLNLLVSYFKYRGQSRLTRSLGTKAAKHTINMVSLY